MSVTEKVEGFVVTAINTSQYQRNTSDMYQDNKDAEVKKKMFGYTVSLMENSK